MPKTVIHLFHDDEDALLTGTRVAQRLLEVAPDHGVGVEVLCFGPAQRHLADGTSGTDIAYNRRIDELIASGVTVGACVNAAEADGSADELRRRGLTLRVARDEFLRFTLEQATVITF
ncbi:hypothetical protein [Streptomyces sp. RFCAC02]|uniref:hypothetical protein n=1 Tax=Streptomyces sp. RFCAC02 TaxID=2499143 RepID=UPI001021D424|nr:hypothetical protein [Streptomyces sp. RFCAC02]